MNDLVGFGRLILAIGEIALLVAASGYGLWQFYELAVLGHTGNGFSDPARRRQADERLKRLFSNAR